MDGDQFGAAAVRVAQRVRDRHLPGERRIVGLELVHLDDALVRHELGEGPSVRVRPSARLAGTVGRLIGERDAELASVELNEKPL